ncbi:MAG: hypothetical protein WD078_15635 [Woeseia sp.]
MANTAEALGVTSRTIEHLKKRFVEEGLELASQRKPRAKPPRDVVFDGAFEARLIALACIEDLLDLKRIECERPGKKLEEIASKYGQLLADSSDELVIKL